MNPFAWNSLSRLLKKAHIWTGQQTFTNINVTGGTVPGAVLDSVIKASSGNLSAAEVTNTVISNYGQTADVTLVLPAAAEGYSVIFNLVTAVAKYFRVDVTGSEIMRLDGVDTTAGQYVGVAAISSGCQIQMYTAPLTGSTSKWVANTISGLWLAG
jgi:hypothetical protein